MALDKTFVLVVLAGIIIFVVGGYFAGRSSNLDNFEEKDLIFQEDFGVIGQAENTYTQKDLGDISVGTTRANRTLKDVEHYTLKNGLFSTKSFEYNFDASNPDSAYITFEVLETNLYGNLIIELNGKKELDIKVMQTAKPTIKLENVRTGSNKLIIKAQSSGARFWAPTIYKLKNIKLTLNDYGIHTYQNTFNLHEYEMNGFDRAELSFFVKKAERAEQLSIKVNKNEIYEQKPIIRATPYNLIFHTNESDLHLGENTITISAGTDAIYDLDNTLLKIFYFGTPEQTSIKRTFYIRASQYKKISQEKYQGLIQFDSKIHLRGDLEIRLQNQTTNRTFDLFPDSGINKIFFDKQDIFRGEQELVLTTDGSMEINDFEIKLIEN